jgi:hypothetical protein
MKTLVVLIAIIVCILVDWLLGGFRPKYKDEGGGKCK